jgi:hypothetical protein
MVWLWKRMRASHLRGQKSIDPKCASDCFRSEPKEAECDSEAADRPVRGLNRNRSERRQCTKLAIEVVLVGASERGGASLGSGGERSTNGDKGGRVRVSLARRGRGRSSVPPCSSPNLFNGGRR